MELPDVVVNFVRRLDFLEEVDKSGDIHRATDPFYRFKAPARKGIIQGLAPPTPNVASPAYTHTMVLEKFEERVISRWFLLTLLAIPNCRRRGMWGQLIACGGRCFIPFLTCIFPDTPSRIPFSC